MSTIDTLNNIPVMAELDKPAQEIFGPKILSFMDRVVRIGATNAENQDEANKLLDQSLRGIFQAKLAQPEVVVDDKITDFIDGLTNLSHIELSEDQKAQLQKQILEIANQAQESAAALSSAERTLYAKRIKPPQQSTQEMAVENLTETAEANADNSGELNKMLNDFLVIALDKLRQDETLDFEQLDALEQVIQADPGKPGELSTEDLKEGIALLGTAISSEAGLDIDEFAAKFAELKPELKHEIHENFTKLMIPALKGNPGIVVSQLLNDQTFTSFKKSVEILARQLPGAEALPALEQANRNEEISIALINAHQEVEALRKSNPNIRAKGLENAYVDALRSQMEILDAKGLELNQEDMKQVTNYMKQVTGTTQQQRNESMASLFGSIKDKAPYLIFVLPIVAGPLAKIFSKIPLIGNSLNQALGQLAQNGSSLVMGLLASKLNLGGSKAVAPANEPAARNGSRADTITAV